MKIIIFLEKNILTFFNLYRTWISKLVRYFRCATGLGWFLSWINCHLHRILTSTCWWKTKIKFCLFSVKTTIWIFHNLFILIKKTSRTFVFYTQWFPKRQDIYIICTLGVSPSLVSRWREGYSFWCGWGP